MQLSYNNIIIDIQVLTYLFNKKLFRVNYNQLTKLNKSLFNQLTIENYNTLTEKYFFTFIKLSKDQFRIQFDTIFNAILNYLYELNIKNEFEIKNPKNGVISKIYTKPNYVCVF